MPFSNVYTESSHKYFIQNIKILYCLIFCLTKNSQHGFARPPMTESNEVSHHTLVHTAVPCTNRNNVKIAREHHTESVVRDKGKCLSIVCPHDFGCRYRELSTAVEDYIGSLICSRVFQEL